MPSIIRKIKKQRTEKSSPSYPVQETVEGVPIEPEHTPGMSRLRLDRPGRRFGGRVGSDRSPLSSAASKK